jgi:restriction endonuclease S subunit
MAIDIQIQYNFYTSTDKVMKCDIADYNEECLIIGTGGNSCIHLSNNFSCSADSFIINSNLIPNKYIYYTMKFMWISFIECMRGSTIKHVSKEMLTKFNIPIPTTDESIKMWVDKISKPYDEKNNKEKKLKELETQIQKRITEITENEDCEEVELGSLCDINYGTRITKKDSINGNIPVYGGGDITFYTNISNRPKNTLIISRYALSKKCVRIIYIPFYLNDSGLSIHSKDSKLQNYISNYMLNNRFQENLHKNITQGSIQRNLNMNLFTKIKIPIPTNKLLITELETTFQEIEKLQDEIKEAEILYKKYLEELSNSAIKNKSQPQEIQEPQETQETQEIPEQQKTPENKPKKKNTVIIKRKSLTPKNITFDSILGNSTITTPRIADES